MRPRTLVRRALAGAVISALFFTHYSLADDIDDADVQTADEDRVTELEQSDQDADTAGILEEVITTGTRSTRPRTASDSTVPIDVLSAEDFDSFGGTNDLTDNLKALVPSYTATPLTGDGSAFVRPTSLRGTAPDQTLVLVDGKRRHRSALLHFFAPAAGNGAHGVDIGMIPGIAVKRVEVLRDGASSQYGSDAIAGVINFITKDDSEGGQAFLQWGQSFESEESLRFGANAGFGIGNGFINASVEYIDNEAFIRAIQRPEAQQLIDAGVDPSQIGADAPFGEQPLLQTWGRPESSGTRLWINSGFDLSNDKLLYFRFGWADTDGRYRFFYRNPNHASLAPLRDMGFTGLPAGYTPFLDGAQEDLYAIGGLEGVFGNDMTYDFSVSYGKNELDYFLNNTVNTSLGLDGSGNIPQMDFDVGAYEQEETMFNADFSKLIRDNMNLAFGAEWREETYKIIAGEPAAYLGVKTSGYASPTPGFGDGSFSRDNWAIYGDIEHDITDEFLLQYALRYEDFSDFGDTLNGKLAFRWRMTDVFNLRGAISTGFHAPTPGQINISTIITTFDGTTGAQVEEGLVPSTDPRIAELGGKPLTEEESTNYSLGFTTFLGDNTTLTVDGYMIEVDGRIYRTGDIPLPPLPSGLETSISFYTNALDVEHSGIDVVLDSRIEWSGGADTQMTLAYNYNKTKVTGQARINGVEPVSEGIIEDIENNYPKHRAVLTTNTFFSDSWNYLLRVNYVGAHYDERGRIGADVDPSLKIGATWFVDMEIGWQVNDNWRLAAGAVNIFDEYPDKALPPNANRLSVGLEYPRRSAANYEGGQWYLRGTFYWQ